MKLLLSLLWLVCLPVLAQLPEFGDSVLALPPTVGNALVASSNNYTIWLVAQDLTGTANNAAPTIVTNRMANGVTFTNIGGAIKSNSLAGGQAALWFDGSSAYLQSIVQTNWNSSVGAQSASFLFVMKQIGTQARNLAFSWQDSELIRLYASYDDVLYFDFPDGSGGRINNAQPAGWDDNLHTYVVVRSNSWAQIRMDGTNVLTGAPSGSMTEAGVNYWRVSDTGNPFKGLIYEVIVANTNWLPNEVLAQESRTKGIYGTP